MTDLGRYTHIYTYNGDITQPQKNEILPFASTLLDLGDIIFSEISQTERDKNCML